MRQNSGLGLPPGVLSSPSGPRHLGRLHPSLSSSRSFLITYSLSWKISLTREQSKLLQAAGLYKPKFLS